MFHPTSALPPGLVPLCVLVIFLAARFLMSRLSGWASLAAHFRTDVRAEGEVFRMVSLAAGWAHCPVRVDGWMRLTINEQGVELAAFPLLRLFFPALFIPWSAIEQAESSRFFLLDTTTLRLRGLWPVVCIRGRRADTVLAAYARYAGR